MNRILSPGWYVVIAIIALIITWKLGTNSGKRSATEIISRQLIADHKAAKASKREAVKRDFNDVDSLITELNEPKESNEPSK